MLELRLAQLDLARQMENLDFIREFIAQMAACGYNGLLLYLEDRVQTASYTLAGEGEYYTADDVTSLVQFAGQHRMMLIPCVATLGHAERFLRHPELRKFAELPDGMCGRFEGEGKFTFCVNHPEFYDFLGTYLAEVAELFPAPYFHIGLDEIWDFNLCPRCRRLMPDLAQEQRGFLEHIRKTRDILARANKRTMMFSDMFEYYPDIFADVPKDVIMVDWQYHEDVRRYLGHLLDLDAEDRIAANARHGFETIIGAVDRCLSNPRTYLECAEGRPLLGCLVTSWEKTDTFLYRTYPIFVYTGFLMRGDADEEAFASMMRQLFGVDDASLSIGVRLALSLTFYRHFGSISDSRLFTRNFFGLSHHATASDKAAYELIRANADKVTTPLGTRVVRDILNALEEKLLSHRMKESVHRIVDHGCASDDLARLQRAATEFGDYIDRMEAQWPEWRSGIGPNVFTAAKARVHRTLEELLGKVQKKAVLRLSLCLPDAYGVEHCEIHALTDGAWHRLAQGVFKQEDLDTALFSRFIPVDWPTDAVPEALRLECYGLGGLGVTFVEFRINGVSHVPSAVGAVSGIVKEPEHLLADNADFAWFGNHSARHDYFHTGLVPARHSVILTLGARSPGQ